jgi:DNA-binding NarL/FixJ family response regulator
MDLRLPGSSGTEAVIAIREEFPYVRIVMLATLDGDGENQRALRAGAAAYLSKSTPKIQPCKGLSTAGKHRGRLFVSGLCYDSAFRHNNPVKPVGRRSEAKRP